MHNARGPVSKLAALKQHRNCASSETANVQNKTLVKVLFGVLWKKLDSDEIHWFTTGASISGESAAADI